MTFKEADEQVEKINKKIDEIFNTPHCAADPILQIKLVVELNKKTNTIWQFLRDTEKEVKE